MAPDPVPAHLLQSPIDCSLTDTESVSCGQRISVGFPDCRLDNRIFGGRQSGSFIVKHPAVCAGQEARDLSDLNPGFSYDRRRLNRGQALTAPAASFGSPLGKFATQTMHFHPLGHTQPPQRNRSISQGVSRLRQAGEPRRLSKNSKAYRLDQQLAKMSGELSMRARGGAALTAEAAASHWERMKQRRRFVIRLRNFAKW